MVQVLIGKKIGMTQIYRDDGTCIPVTAIKVGPCYIVQIRTKERDGYDALQIGFDVVKEKALNRPLLGHLKKARCPPLRVLAEVRCDDVSKYNPGDKLTVDIFKDTLYVDVSGVTKGRGSTGVVKRWGFAGQPASHGESQGERHPGSLGRQQSIGKGIYKGKKMAGRYGNERVTIKNLQVAGVLSEKNCLLVKGAVPGPNGGYVKVKKSLKNEIIRKKQEKKEFYHFFAPPKVKKKSMRDLDRGRR